MNERIQTALKYLVIAQVVTFITSFAALRIFPTPEEFVAAEEVRAELGKSGWGIGFGLILRGLDLGAFGLWAWSLWQLYHLDERGFVRFIQATGVMLVLEMIVGGIWVAGVESALIGIHFLVSGAIICIGLLFTNAYDQLLAEARAWFKAEEIEKEDGQDEAK